MSNWKNEKLIGGCVTLPAVMASVEAGPVTSEVLLSLSVWGFCQLMYFFCMKIVWKGEACKLIMLVADAVVFHFPSVVEIHSFCEWKY